MTISLTDFVLKGAIITSYGYDPNIKLAVKYIAIDKTKQKQFHMILTGWAASSSNLSKYTNSVFNLSTESVVMCFL